MNNLNVKIDVIKLKNNKIKIPKNLNKIFIEVGTNSRNVVINEELKLDKNAFYIGFEPLLNQYSNLISKYNSKPDSYGELGKIHDRGYLLPIAIAESNGYIDFNVSPVDGCSSVLKTQQIKNDKMNKWDNWVINNCNSTIETRKVPCMTLLRLFDLLDNREIFYLKIDAQGYDLNVIKSAGNKIRNIRFIKLEVQADKDLCDNIYKNQSTCSNIVEYMKSKNFYLFNDERCSEWKTCEKDQIWIRNDIKKKDIPNYITNNTDYLSISNDNINYNLYFRVFYDKYLIKFIIILIFIYLFIQNRKK